MLRVFGAIVFLLGFGSLCYFGLFQECKSWTEVSNNFLAQMVSATAVCFGGLAFVHH